MKPKALDLFCGAGGATRGLQLADFHVTGVDIKPQPRYVGDDFIERDAMEIPIEVLAAYDYIWASPLCQKHTTLVALHPGKFYACYIAVIRHRLTAAGIPWSIENVIGAPLRHPVQLCGSAFGLRVRRHRIVESSVPISGTRCNHAAQGQPIDVSGTGSRRVTCKRMDGAGGDSNKPRNLAEARAAMGIDWMNRYEISQAIPPAYSQYIGEQMMPHVLRRMAERQVA